MSPDQEGEDYGKGVIFYLRENKVMNGKHLLHWKVKSYSSARSDSTYKPTCSNEPTMLKELPLIDAGGWSASLERVQQNVNCQEVIKN